MTFKTICSNNHIVENVGEGSSNLDFCGYAEKYCDGVILLVSTQGNIYNSNLEEAK